MQEKVKSLTQKYYKKIVELRHQIHMHPELEFEEEHTAELICTILDEAGIKYQNKIAKTGILATIKGEKKDKNPKCVHICTQKNAFWIFIFFFAFDCS